MRFAAERGLYAISTNFDDKSAFVVNYRDKVSACDAPRPTTRPRPSARGERDNLTPRLCARCPAGAPVFRHRVRA